MKKAIVVGASSGIGRALARILAKKHYVVGVMARRVNLLNELKNEAECNIVVQEIDVRDAETAMAILDKFIHKMGGIDLIVISAGTGLYHTSMAIHCMDTKIYAGLHL